MSSGEESLVGKCQVGKSLVGKSPVTRIDIFDKTGTDVSVILENPLDRSCILRLTFSRLSAPINSMSINLEISRILFNLP